LQEPVAAANELLAECRNTSAKARALIGDGWLPDAANVPYPNVLAK
jgi:hypothetical protein